jgi:hypothetical protein
MKNYTSTVPFERSVEEIEKLLVRAGARSISKEYANNEVAALNFVILCPETNAPLGVRLPADVDAVFLVLKKGRSPRAAHSRGWEQRLREQSKRTAWKLMFDWVAVQLSLIEMKQAELMQVFLPYLWAGKTTFYESIKQDKFKAIGYSGDGGDTEGK